MMKKSIFIFIFLSFFSCKKEEFEIINLNNNAISVFGHGGMGIGHTYPMNTFESIAYCLNLGADGTEIDVQMTIDSVLVAFHDLDLSEGTNISGNIYTKTWDEIYHARYKNPVFANYRLINLDMLFSGLRNKNEKLFMLDCKNYNPDTSVHYKTTFSNALIKIIDKYDLADNVIIGLKREYIISTLRALRPALKIFVNSDFENGLITAKKYQLQGLVIPVDEITSEQVSIAHQNGLQISVFNAHTHKRNIEAIRKNVDLIQTDLLKHLLKTLK